MIAAALAFLAGCGSDSTPITNSSDTPPPETWHEHHRSWHKNSTTTTTLPPVSTTTTTTIPNQDHAGIGCYGDGRSGERFQAIYARSSDVVSQYDARKPTMVNLAVGADAIFNNSARKHGDYRHTRWVTNATANGCELNILNVTMSPEADDSFGATANWLFNNGYRNNLDRKLVVWVESGAVCGVGSFYVDYSKDRLVNWNEGERAGVLSNVARIDTNGGCFGARTTAHEMMHTLGTVDPASPNGTTNGHCTDDNDTMCYKDGADVVMQDPKPCLDAAAENIFDCNDNDYFYTDVPPVGSYLSTHWNAADSAWLDRNPLY